MQGVALKTPAQHPSNISLPGICIDYQNNKGGWSCNILNTHNQPKRLHAQLHAGFIEQLNCATEEMSSRLALVGDLHRSTSSGMKVPALM